MQTRFSSPPAANTPALRFSGVVVTRYPKDINLGRGEDRFEIALYGKPGPRREVPVAPNELKVFEHRGNLSYTEPKLLETVVDDPKNPLMSRLSDKIDALDQHYQAARFRGQDQVQLALPDLQMAPPSKGTLSSVLMQALGRIQDKSCKQGAMGLLISAPPLAGDKVYSHESHRHAPPAWRWSINSPTPARRPSVTA